MNGMEIMTKEELYDQIKAILVREFELDTAEIRPDSSLYEELGLDSIDAVDLIVELKPFIPGKIEPDLFKQTKTVQDVVDVVYPLLPQKQGG